MNFVFYTHSLVSDWNHGNAHFLRGVMRELQELGHETIALEPEDGWSRTNLRADRGEEGISRFTSDFPMLRAQTYDEAFDHEAATETADVVVVHEWTDPSVIARLGRMRACGARFLLLFHDTHHRAVSAREEINRLDLDGYDGVLAFGEALREIYLKAGWRNQVFTWHEAADTALFRPHLEIAPDRDLIWIGNWGDGERSEELREFLVGPSAELGLTATVHGVRYPPEALESLERAGISYEGSIANADAPKAFARHRLTVHVPRRPYVEALPGIPTIRMFEALACGIPLVSVPWEDKENLFRPGRDFLFARTPEDMRRAMRRILSDPAFAAELARSGLETIRSRHSCAHRARELVAHVARSSALVEEVIPA